MRRYLYARVLTLLVLTLSLVVTPAGVSRVGAQGNGGLQGDDGYVSPQFGYTVTWGESWGARARDVISNPGGYDTLTLRSDLGNLWIQGQGDTESAASAVERRISIQGRPADVVSQDLTGEVPTVEMLVGRDKVLIEGHTLEDSDAVVVIVLSARERNFDDALALVHDEVLFNESHILTSSAIAETDNGDETIDVTEEGSGTAVSEEETAIAQDPEGDEPEDDEPRADGDEDDPRDDPVDDDAAGEDEPAESNVEDGVFTSQVYDYTFEFDEDTWVVEEEFDADGVDGAHLSSDIGSLTIWSWDAYGADAFECLDGEAEYYSSDDSAIVDWDAAEDADGDPLAGDGEGYAWAVYELVYENEDGDELELVEFVECREMPEDDAVLIIYASALPEDFGDHLDQSLEVIDSIEISGERLVDDGGTEPEETVEPEETEEPVDDPEDVDTGFSGSLFTSPAYGYTLEIPSNWRIESEELAGNDETIVVANGTSVVTIWATDEYAGGLAGCVDFAAEESGLDLALDVNADGQPFRGEGRIEAYGNFRYTSEDGVDMMFHISCRAIVDGESVLIITHDVPYDDFTSQRKFRAEIEDSIIIPD